jgi:rubrerythrin
MQIFDFVMQMEKDGEAYYRDLAEKVRDEGVARILLMMADDEVKHYKIFEAMKKGNPDMVETVVLKNAKNIFQEMKDQKEFNFDGTERDALSKAREVELHSEKFYLEKVDQVDSVEHKDLFRRIAGEERHHAHLLDYMMEFVTRPETWIDDAEFSNLEDY